MKMREIINLCESNDRLDERSLSDAEPYPYHFANRWIETHEQHEGGGRLSHPIERTRYAFSSENGLEYVVNCNLQNHVLETSFSALRMGFSKTGAGDAIRVFATVMQILRDYIDADPPRVIEFTAKRDEPSRVRLYDRMFRNLQPDDLEDRPKAVGVQHFLPGFELTERRPLASNIQYKLTRPLTPADADRDREDERQAAEERTKRDAARAEKLRQQAEEEEGRRNALQEPPMTQDEWDDIEALMAELRR